MGKLIANRPARLGLLLASGVGGVLFAQAPAANAAPFPDRAVTATSIAPPMPTLENGIPANTPIYNYVTKSAHATLAGIGPLSVAPGVDLHGVTFSINGRRNTGFLTPNGKYLIVGVAIDAEGHNVTLEALAHEEERLASAMKQAGALVEQTRQQAGGVAGGSSLPVAAAALPTLPGPAVADAVPAALSPAQPSPDSHAPSDAQDSTLRWQVSGVKPKALETDIGSTAFFLIGHEDAPTVTLFANPDCPHCHAAWAQLRPYIDAGKISVRIVLADPDRENDAIALLSNPDIEKAWLAGQGSEDGVPIVGGASISTPAWRDAHNFLRDNNMIADKYIQMLGLPGKAGLPVLVYSASDRVYGREGVSSPADMASFLSALVGVKPSSKASP